MGRGIKFGQRNLEKKKHWHDSYYESSFSIPDSDKKKIICLPGDQCNSAKKANGMCKLAEALLSDEAKDKCEVWSAYWPDASETCYDDFYHHHFLPIVASASGVEKAKNGKKLSKEDALPLETAKRNMRNLLLFTHCKGTDVAEDLEKYFCDKMSEMEYSKADISAVMKQLFVLNANDQNVSFGKAKSSVLRRVSYDDPVGPKGKFVDIKTYLRANPPRNDMYFLECSGNEGIIFIRKALSEDVLDTNDHDDGFLVRDKMNEVGKKAFDLSGAIFSEVILTSGDMPDISALAFSSASKRGDEIFFGEVKANGAQYMKEYEDYKQSSEKLRERIINQVKKGDLTELPIEADFAMLTESYHGTESVVDYSIKKGKPEQLALILNRIKENSDYIGCLYRDLGDDAKTKFQKVFEPYVSIPDSKDGCFMFQNIVISREKGGRD